MFFANVDGIAADAFVKTRDGGANSTRKGGAYKKALVTATAKYWEQLHKGYTSVPDVVGTGWPGFAFTLAETAKNEKEKVDGRRPLADPVALVEPVLIRYDEKTGRALGEAQQRVLVNAPSERIR